MNYLSNEQNWDRLFQTCSKCFPKDYRSNVPCAPQCLFTLNGKGAPPVIEAVFEGKTPPENNGPYFVIAYGAAGSGKSDVIPILNHIKELEDINDTNTIDINVDKVFQAGPLAADYERAKAHILTDKMYRHDKRKYTQRLYFTYRWVADQLADSILNLALLGKYNVRWESTGGGPDSLAWTKKEIKRIKSYGYTVVLAMPLASTETIIKRMKKREDETGQEATPSDVVTEKRETALANLELLIASDQPIDTDVLERANRVVIYDNNADTILDTNKPIIYDSSDPKNEKHRKNLTKYLALVESDKKLLAWLEKKTI